MSTQIKLSKSFIMQTGIIYFIRQYLKNWEKQFKHAFSSNLGKATFKHEVPQIYFVSLHGCKNKNTAIFAASFDLLLQFIREVTHYMRYQHIYYREGHFKCHY